MHSLPLLVNTVLYSMHSITHVQMVSSLVKKSGSDQKEKPAVDKRLSERGTSNNNKDDSKPIPLQRKRVSTNGAKEAVDSNDNTSDSADDLFSDRRKKAAPSHNTGKAPTAAKSIARSKPIRA